MKSIMRALAFAALVACVALMLVSPAAASTSSSMLSDPAALADGTQWASLVEEMPIEAETQVEVEDEQALVELDAELDTAAQVSSTAHGDNRDSGSQRRDSGPSRGAELLTAC